MNRKLSAFAAVIALAAFAAFAGAAENQAKRLAQQTPAQPPPKAADAGERKPIYYRNPMGLPDISPVPKKDSMGMDYIPVYEGEDDAMGVKISPEKIQCSGVRSEEVAKRVLSRTVRAPGIVALDERRIPVIALRFDGFLEKIEDVTTGSHVKAGDPLMTIYAPELLKIGSRLVVEEQTGWGPAAPETRAPGTLRNPQAFAGRSTVHLETTAARSRLGLTSGSSF